MITWREVAAGEDGLRLYRVDAEADAFGGGGGARGMLSPLDLILARSESTHLRRLQERFSEPGAPVGASTFSVACHVVSLPDLLFVTDSTYRSSAPEVFPGALEAIARHEGRALAVRPIEVLYTHAHFDHAGGHRAVEALDGAARTLAHPFTARLAALVGKREGFLRTREGFLRDCGVEGDLDALAAEIRDHFLRLASTSGIDLAKSPWGAAEDGALRVDLEVDPEAGSVERANGRIRVLRFDGHLPGHLCVLVDGRHLITGDMWLPGTTSLVTPGTLGPLSGIPEDRFGLLRYLESNERLLASDLDECLSYPSHEVIFQNPKRMAMRDLELLDERLDGVYAVLAEHRTGPLRVIDLASGGAEGLPLWKVGRNLHRLAIAHDEATAYVQDLTALGDLRPVAPGQWLWTGRSALHDRTSATLKQARERYGQLEFRSRGLA